MHRAKLAWLGVAALLLSGQAPGETLVIAGDLWCPFNCAPDSPRPGIYVELARDIFAEAGIGVEYRVINWARALQEVRHGHINAAIGAARSDAPDLVFTEQPVSQSRNCFYTVRENQWRFDSLKSLHAQRLAVVNDYSYGEELDAYVQAEQGNPQRLQAASGQQALGQNLAKLLEGRVDVVLENSWVMQEYLARRGYIGTVRHAGCQQPDIPIYLAFSPALPRSRDYVQLLDQGLRRYRADGRMQTLLERYGVREGR